MSSTSTIFGIVGGALGFVLSGFNVQAAIVGYTLGATLGSILTPHSFSELPPPSVGELQIMSSGYGRTIPVVYGTRKISGQVLWYGNFQTRAIQTETTEEGSSKGGGGSPQTQTTYYYSCTLAIGLGFGLTGAKLSKLWAGKNLAYDPAWGPSDFRRNNYSINFHDGSQVVPDDYLSLFVPRAPVWKDLCYVVMNCNLGISTGVPNFEFEVGFGEREFLTKWGSHGAGDGQFNLPTGIKKYHGKIYVLDQQNNRVQVFDTAGTYLSHFHFNAAVVAPSLDLDVYGDRVYVTAYGSGQAVVHVYTLTGTYIGAFGTPGAGNGQFAWHYGISVHDDIIYVADYGNDRIQLFDLNGGYLSQFGNGTVFGGPLGVFVDDNYIYVTDRDWGCVAVYNHSWALQRTIGTPGAGDGNVHWPTEAVSDGTYLYVADWDNNRVAIFLLSGAWSANLGSLGSGSGLFDRPIGIDVDDRLYIADYNNDRVQIFSLYLDANPADVARDILTNDLYGLGLANTYLDEDSFEVTRGHCLANDLRVSMLYDRQRSVLDVLQNLLSHHDGYICYKDGLIYYRQMKTETPLMALDGNAGGDLVLSEKKLPIGLMRRGSRERQNRVQVEYTKAAAEYSTGFALAGDMADIDITGLREITVRLDGLTSYSRASKLAFLLLQKSIGNPEQLTFGLGPANRNLSPGDVVSISNTALELSVLPIRFQALREGLDYRLEAEAVEELDVYDYITDGADSSDPPDVPDLFNDPGNVRGLLLVEPPASYAAAPFLVAIYSAGIAVAWAGAALYRAYTAGGSYVQQAQGVRVGVTGTVDAVGSAAGIAHIDVTLDSNATLSSATDFDDLLSTPRKNLIMVRRGTADIYIRFQDADLIGTNQWRLSGLVCDIVGTPRLNTYGTVQAADKMAVYSAIPIQLAVAPADAGRTLYIKVASFNFGGYEQSLAVVSETSIALTAKYARPMAPGPVIVGGIGVDAGCAVTVAAGDIALAWATVNRQNAGSANYVRSDAVADDAEKSGYTIEVYYGATLLRSAAATSKAWTYTAAMQAADGGPFGQYDILIRQDNSDYSSEWTLVTVYAV